MPISKAKREANNRWDAEHMAYQTIKLPKEELERFRAACKFRGHRVNTVLRTAMKKYVDGSLIINDEAEQNNQSEVAQNDE